MHGLEVEIRLNRWSELSCAVLRPDEQMGESL